MRVFPCIRRCSRILTKGSYLGGGSLRRDIVTGGGAWTEAPLLLPLLRLSLAGSLAGGVGVEITWTTEGALCGILSVGVFDNSVKGSAKGGSDVVVDASVSVLGSLGGVSPVYAGGGVGKALSDVGEPSGRA